MGFDTLGWNVRDGFTTEARHEHGTVWDIMLSWCCSSLQQAAQILLLPIGKKYPLSIQYSWKRTPTAIAKLMMHPRIPLPPFTDPQSRSGERRCNWSSLTDHLETLAGVVGMRSSSSQKRRSVMEVRRFCVDLWWHMTGSPGGRICSGTLRVSWTQNSKRQVFIGSIIWVTMIFSKFSK